MDVIAYYQQQLQQYTLAQLQYRAPNRDWSIGQLYDHIICVALEYLSHIQTCAASTVEQFEGKTEGGEDALSVKQFPAIKIKSP